ncbi:MAG: tRNA (uridine(34)/cytosine(34)/5-carboxymethylaminomethyluridine(34)-2'-O)-methyltransferase TrmL [Gammaproteobacteria bacterium]|nr:tRNA (uridine(34)/cytosine(34)/5-carboxymethylaminomethyluridine(34)-2'-O)-methyltransferase TrmL [Gammaproteobacteria bacterium]
MFNIILYQPEIPPNTGNIIRLCANTGCRLHLIHPLGFQLDEKRLTRAGMDYRELAQVEQHQNLDEFYTTVKPRRVFAVSTKGKTCYADIRFEDQDCLLFGPETRGLPDRILSEFGPEKILRIPMLDQSRSLNLANAVAVIVYEAWRQQGFE